MARDLSDLNHDGKTTDLRPYADIDNNFQDDWDPGMRYNDQNGDLDYYDTTALLK